MIFLGNIVGFSVFSTVGDTNIEIYVGVFSTLLRYGSNLIFKKCYCGGKVQKSSFRGYLSLELTSNTIGWWILSVVTRDEVVIGLGYDIARCIA